jgi:hypothetical protein
MHPKECVSIARVPATFKHAGREGEFFSLSFFGVNYALWPAAFERGVILDTGNKILAS